MGQSQCLKPTLTQPSELPQQTIFRIAKPPEIKQPTEIQNLQSPDLQSLVECDSTEPNQSKGEKQPTNIKLRPQISLEFQQSNETAQIPWIQKKSEEESRIAQTSKELIAAQNILSPSHSYKEVVEQSQSQNSSARGISSQQIGVKSILKQKQNVSPKAEDKQLLQQNSMGSQRSIKKVKFEQKKHPQYSSFRKVNQGKVN